MEAQKTTAKNLNLARSLPRKYKYFASRKVPRVSLVIRSLSLVNSRAFERSASVDGRRKMGVIHTVLIVFFARTLTHFDTEKYIPLNEYIRRLSKGYGVYTCTHKKREIVQ